VWISVNLIVKNYCKGHFTEGPTDVLTYTLRLLANFDKTVKYTSNIFGVNVVMSKFDLLLIHFMSWIKISYTLVIHMLCPQQRCLREADFASISIISRNIHHQVPVHTPITFLLMQYLLNLQTTACP
jgi:hypothetical protein